MRIFGSLGARPVKHGDIADALHEGAAAALRQAAHQCIARGAVPAGGLHLDELVIVERARRFAHDRLGETGIAQAHDRVQGVGEPAQVSFLALAEFRSGGRGGPLIGFAHGRHCMSAELVPHRRPLTFAGVEAVAPAHDRAAAQCPPGPDGTGGRAPAASRRGTVSGGQPGGPGGWRNPARGDKPGYLEGGRPCPDQGLAGWRAPRNLSVGHGPIRHG